MCDASGLRSGTVNTSLLQLPGRRRDARAGLEDAVVAAELAKLLAEGPRICCVPVCMLSLDARLVRAAARSCSTHRHENTPSGMPGFCGQLVMMLDEARPFDEG